MPKETNNKPIIIEGIFIEGWKCRECDKLHALHFNCDCCGNVNHNYIQVIMWCDTENETILNIELN